MRATRFDAADGTILDALARRARDTPDALAYRVERESLSFRQLSDEARWLARRLRRAGVSTGDRCALVLETSPGFIRAVFAAQMLGAIPVAISPALPPAGQRRRLAIVEPVVTLAEPQVLAGLSSPSPAVTGALWSTGDLAARPEAVGPLAGAPGPEDVAYLQFTSGSTGEPRAASVAHASLASNLAAIQQRFDLSPADVVATWVPLHHSTGLVRYLFGAVWFGTPCHLVRPSALRLARWLELIDQVGATVTSAPDFAYRLTSRTVSPSQVSLRTLRLATNGGEPVRASTIERFEQRFGLQGRVQPAYGLSEATLIVSSGAPGDPLAVDDAGVVSCGTAMPGLDVRIVDERGDACVPRREGEIQVRGRAVFQGYFRDVTETGRALHEGWLRTGDLATMDEAGRLYPRARTRTLIKRAGSGIAPREIEEQVELLGGVVASAALGIGTADGITDDVLVVAEIDVRGRAAPRDLALQVEAAVTATIGAGPSRIVLVEEGAMPRTTGGKVGYAELRQLVDDPVFRSEAIFVS